jgi:hypothetical protein
MKLFIIFFAVTTVAFSQNPPSQVQWFKGEHFVLYNKCLAPIIFCENTQQTYNFCSSYSNCYGLYVMPGDTFYVNLEDKNQSKTIAADISFSGYFPTLTQVVFIPVNNISQCLPPQALQIVIPLNATLGSSFLIEAQNVNYVNAIPNNPASPLPIPIQIGGTNSQLMVSLSDFTVCPQIDEIDTTQVGLNEVDVLKNTITISPNPVINNLEINIRVFQTPIQYGIMGIDGCVVKSGKLESSINDVQLNNLPAGMYFISFSLNNLVFETKKLVITD